MRIKRFNESLSEEIILFNNKGYLKFGSLWVHQRGLSGTSYIKDINDVDWDKLTISYYNNQAGATYRAEILPESISKLTPEVKQLIWESDKKEEFLKCSFCFENPEDPEKIKFHGVAKLIHISPEFKRTKDGGVITSYIDKLTY